MKFKEFNIASKISIIFGSISVCLQMMIVIIFIMTQHTLINHLIEQRQGSIEESIQKIKKQRIKVLENEVEVYSEIVNQTISSLMYQVDEKGMLQILKAFLDLEWLTAFSVMDENGKHFLSVWRDENGQLQNNTKALPVSFRVMNNLTKSNDISYRNKRLGVIKIFYSDVVLFQELNDIRTFTLQQLQNEEQKAVKNLTKATIQQIFITLFATLLVSIISFIVGRAISLPILRVASCLNSLGQHDDLSIVRDIKRKDELGIIARGYQITKKSILAIITEIGKNTKQLAKASDVLAVHSVSLFDLSEQVQKQAVLVTSHADANGKHVHTIAKATTQSSAHINNINQRISKMSLKMEMVASSAAQSSTNMSQISLNIKNITSDIRKVTNSIETMAQDLSAVSHHSSDAIEIAKTAHIQIQKSLNMLSKLQDASQKIHSAVQIISTISNQTNMLSLNATIEAVSSGDAGEGFAVVAGEVKTLARKTAQANDQIRKIIEQIREYVNVTEETILQTSEVIAKVVENNIIIGESINRQSMASNAITQSVDSIARQSEEASEKIQKADQDIKDIHINASGIATLSKTSSQNFDDVSSKISEIADSTGNVYKGINTVIENIKNIHQEIAEWTEAASRNKQNSGNLKKLAENLMKASNLFQTPNSHEFEKRSA